MDHQKSFTIKALPKTWASEEEFLDLVTAYRSYCLFKLRSAPDAFAVTYEQEIQSSHDTWIQRLRNKDAVQFVACRNNKEEWVGMIVVSRPSLDDGALQPVNYNLDSAVIYAKSTAGIDIEDASSVQGLSSLLYKINALFVDPSARGRGLGRSLVRECLDFVEKDTRTRRLVSSKVRIIVDSWNEHAIKLYSSLGFESVGSADYAVGSSSRNAITMELDMSLEYTST